MRLLLRDGDANVANLKHVRVVEVSCASELSHPVVAMDVPHDAPKRGLDVTAGAPQVGEVRNIASAV